MNPPRYPASPARRRRSRDVAEIRADRGDARQAAGRAELGGDGRVCSNAPGTCLKALYA